MLMVTENASQALEAIVADAEMPDGSGLRIDTPEELQATPDRSGVPLQLEVTSQPAAQDQVVSEGGAKVFIAPAAAPILDDKVLDKGGAYTMAVYFNLGGGRPHGRPQEPPPELQVQLEEMAALSVGEPEFFDLKQPWLHSPR
jgi:Fe-S cluster assembly iron-binding protein IscA